MLLIILEKSWITSKEMRSVNKMTLKWWDTKTYVLVSMELSWRKISVEEEVCRYVKKISEYQI